MKLQPRQIIIFLVMLLAIAAVLFANTWLGRGYTNFSPGDRADYQVVVDVKTALNEQQVISSLKNLHIDSLRETSPGVWSFYVSSEMGNVTNQDITTILDDASEIQHFTITGINYPLGGSN